MKSHRRRALGRDRKLLSFVVVGFLCAVAAVFAAKQVLSDANLTHAVRLTEVRRLSHFPSVLVAVAWSPDGKRIAGKYFAAYGVPVWDVDSGKLIRVVDTKFPNIAATLSWWLAFVNDGHALLGSAMEVSTAENRLAASTIDIEHDTILQSFRAPSQVPDKRIPYAASHMALSPDGRWLAVQYAGDGSLPIGVYSVETGAVVAIIDHQKYSPGSALSFCGTNLLAQAETGGMVEIWDIPKSALLRTIRAGASEFSEKVLGRMQTVRSLACSPDGRLLVSGGQEAGRGLKDFIRLWDVATGAKVRFYVAPDFNPKSIAFSPNGKLFAATGDKQVWLWSVDSTELVERRALPDYGNGLAFSPDGRQLAVASDNKIIIYDVKMTNRVKSCPNVSTPTNSVA